MPEPTINPPSEQSSSSPEPEPGPGQSIPLFIHEPALPHHSSIIILHGRGDIGPSFGRHLLWESSFTLPNPDGLLRRAFPNTRFIFPTASRRASVGFRTWKLHQWFDYLSLHDPSLKPELQDAGLRENARWMEELIEEEAAKVGMENVFVGGISNGAAMMLVAVLIMVGERRLSGERRLGGVFVLCGWLPYARNLKRMADSRAKIQGAEIGRVEIDTVSPLGWLCEHLSAVRDTKVSASNPREALHGRTCSPSEAIGLPVFLAHGKEDATVPLERLHDASSALTASGFDVQSKEYEDLGHWYSDGMLADLVHWAKEGSL